jgi:hypothetical protein
MSHGHALEEIANSLNGQQGDSEGSGKQKVIFQGLTL